MTEVYQQTRREVEKATFFSFILTNVLIHNIM